MPTSAKILIAEDNLPGAELLDAYLADTPYDTKQAHNGEEAIKLVAEWKPDVVLLDVMMPKLSGFEVCKQIRANPATRDIGILMVTALDQPADIDRAVDLGTDDFLTKPINKTELIMRIRALLKAKSVGEALPRTLEYLKAIEEKAV
jgi:two-component system, OmpR family, alkaline phosphatase synthesis response regulator PhoP